MISTRFTRLFGIERPVVQGGLAHLAFGRLAAAVSNAGGLGQITAATFPTAEALREEIRLCQSLTSKPFAVNFALGHRPLNDLLDVALEEGVRYVSFTAGNPEGMIKQIRDSGLENEVKILVLIAGIRAAQKAESLGAHTVIAVGYEGGGHLGRDDTSTMILVPRILDAVKIPVLASGGIGDARGYAAALAMGAAGIEMGTRFVATQECIAHENYKNALVEARETETQIIERSIGRPARVLNGSWVNKIAALEGTVPPPPVEKLLPLISGERNKRAAIEGHMEEGFVWAGQVAGLIDDIPTVQELLDRLTNGAETIIKKLAKETIVSERSI
ncbi:MAG TPA: nitronate monooxygenase [Chloroflexia bacterium]|nr:nitronate monooxygenase [Chloroflexia bacterium]